MFQTSTAAVTSRQLVVGSMGDKADMHGALPSTAKGAVEETCSRDANAMDRLDLGPLLRAIWEDLCNE